MLEYLETIQISVALFPVLGLLIYFPIHHAHMKRFGEFHEYRAFVAYLCAFAVFSAMMLTVLPLPRIDQPACHWIDRVKDNQFIPLRSFYDIILYKTRHHLGWDVHGLVANMALWQILLNFLMLVPFGFLFRALYGESLARSILYTFLISLFFETTQLTGIWGLAHCPYRVFDVDDLLTNTLGGVFGWWLYYFFRWLPDPRARLDIWSDRRKIKAQKARDADADLL